MPPRTPPTVTTSPDPDDPFEALRELLGTHGAVFRIYRKDPRNPSDVNGEYLGQMSGFDPMELESQIQAKYGGGLYKVQAAVNGTIVKGGTFANVRIGGPPKLQAPVYAAGAASDSTWPQVAPMPPPADPVAMLNAKFDKLLDVLGGNAKPKPEDDRITKADLLNLFQRQHPAADPLVHLERLVPLLGVLKPQSQFSDMLQGYSVLRKLEGDGGGGSKIDDVLAGLAQDPMVRSFLTDLYQEWKDKRARGAPGAPPPPKKPVRNTAADAPKAAIPSGTPDPTAAAATAPEWVGIVSASIVDELTRDPKLRAASAARQLVGSFGADQVRALIEDLDDGRAAAMIINASAALQEPKRRAWVFAFEGAVRAVLDEDDTGEGSEVDEPDTDPDESGPEAAAATGEDAKATAAHAAPN